MTTRPITRPITKTFTRPIARTITKTFTRPITRPITRTFDHKIMISKILCSAIVLLVLTQTLMITIAS